MALISLQNISLGFGGPQLLDNVSLQIESGERICLLGRNGAGKSTLMKIITGEVEPDSGNISKSQGFTATYLSQDVPNDIEGAIFDVVSSNLGERSKLLHEYHETSLKLAKKESEELLEKLDELHHKLDLNGGWQINQEVERILSIMKLDPDAEFSKLSSGMKRRVLLAKALVAKPDILLLDEPTNHLDIEAIRWMEDFLKSFSGTIFFVTHDRTFLQKLATRIVEIERGKLFNWDCDYQTFLKRKEEWLHAEEQQNKLFDKKLAKEEVWIRQGILARRTRNEGRVRELKKMREVRRSRRERTGKVNLQVHEAEKSGKSIVDAENVSFSYGDEQVIKSLSTLIIRGDKVGIIGPNGCGKTTLLKILLGKLKPNNGKIKYGSRLEVVYFDQLRAQLDEEKTVKENIGDGKEFITINGRDRHVFSYLQDFLFSSDRAKTPVWILSGGEKNRLLLAQIFARPSNVLVLDEPTNDLDAETLELLEELLLQYQGTLLLVSHDRTFLNNVVTNTLAFDEDGTVNEYVGGYDDYIRQRPEKGKPDSDKKTKKAKAKKEKPKKLTFKEKFELEELPKKIESLENEKTELENKMIDPDFYKSEAHRVNEIKDRLETVEKELTETYNRWEELELIRENQS